MPLAVYPSPATEPPAQVQPDMRPATGVLGPDGQLVTPPASPGREVRLTRDTTGVVEHCDALEQEIAKRGLKVVRKMVSLNVKYGVVWRADLTVSGDTRHLSRLICWRNPGGDYTFWDQPLEMFDPSASVPPLSP